MEGHYKNAIAQKTRFSRFFRFFAFFFAKKSSFFGKIKFFAYKVFWE